MAETAALVDIFVSDNATVQDAFQFGDPTDTSWTLVGMSFKMEVKASNDDTAPIVTWTSGGGQIVIDDVNQRVIHLNVPDTVLQSSLPPACYVYDLIMSDGSTPAIRTQLMYGRFAVRRGVTED